MNKKPALKAITVRVTDKELKALKLIAKKTGQSLSSAVRNVIYYDIIKYAEKNRALKVLIHGNAADMKKNKGKQCRK